MISPILNKLEDTYSRLRDRLKRTDVATEWLELHRRNTNIISLSINEIFHDPPRVLFIQYFAAERYLERERAGPERILWNANRIGIHLVLGAEMKLRLLWWPLHYIL